MKAIIMLDDKNGMMFNKRRQSRDSALITRVAEISKDERLLMNAYSEKLFENVSCEKTVAEDFLEIAKPEDFCFIENKEVPIENCEKIFVFCWNRVYPADMFFNHDLEKEGFGLESIEEFIGSSHEKITLKIFKKG